jgi:hypothetical protein
LGVNLVNPGNQIISKGTVFTIKAINRFNVDLVWTYTEISGLSVIKSDPSGITFLCTNPFTERQLSVNARRFMYTSTITIQITGVNSPDNFKFLSITPSNVTFTWSGGMYDNLYTIKTEPPTNMQYISWSPSLSNIKTTTFSNINIASGQVYSFIITTNSSNTQYGQNIQIGSLTTAPLLYSPAPSNITFGTITPTDVLINFDSIKYATKYSIVSTPITTTQITTLSPYTFSNLIHGTSYTFTITSINSLDLPCASITSGSIAYADSPTNLQVVSLTTSDVGLTWTAGAGDISYIIYATPKIIINNQTPLFGASMAISPDQNTLFIGAPWANDWNGIIEIYTKEFINSKQSWINTSSILCPLSIIGDNAMFGYSIDISSSGSNLFIGAPGVNNYTGIVEIYSYIEGEWINSDTITPTFNNNELIGYPSFGTSISISQNNSNIFIGAPGATNNDGRVDIFRYNSNINSWSNISSILCPQDISGYNVKFGTSIVVSPNNVNLFIGTPCPTNNGLVEVYNNISGIWTKVSRILCPPTLIGKNAYFGLSLTISADGLRLFIGAPNATIVNGIVYIYNYYINTNLWVQSSSISCPSIIARESTLFGTFFGSSILIENDNTLLISAPYGNNNNGLIEIFTYEAITNRWDSDINDHIIYPFPSFEQSNQNEYAVGFSLNASNNFHGALFTYTNGLIELFPVSILNTTSIQTTSTLPSFQSPYIFSNLSTSNTSYSIIVNALNISNQQGGFSQIISGSYPYSPTNISIETFNSSTATLSWTYSLNATSYSIVSLPATTTQITTTAPYIFTGLTGGTSYTFKITSLNNLNQGYDSSSLISTPFAFAMAPTSFQIQTYTPSNIDLLWTAGAGDASYIIISSNLITSELLTQSTSVVPTILTPYTFSNLATSNTIYTMTIRAYSEFNQEGASTQLTTGLYAYAVSNLTIVSLTSNTTTLSWTPGSNATSYSIISSPETTTQLATTSPYTFLNLTEGTTYTFTVISRNSENRLFESNTSPPALYASTPTNFQIQTFTESNVGLVWIPGANDDNYKLLAIEIFTGESNIQCPTAFQGLNTHFGTTIAISPDGKTLVSSTDATNIQVYSYISNNWINTSQIIYPIGFNQFGFGAAMTFSPDGNTLLISATSIIGAIVIILVYTYSGNIWTNTSQITCPNNLQDIDGNFGSAMVFSPDGNTLYIGENGYRGGLVLIYTYSENTWIYNSQITRPSNIQNYVTSFGTAIIISKDGNTLYISSIGRNGSYNGSIIIYTKTNGTWVKTTTIECPIPMQGIQGSFIMFGNCMALSPDENTLVISEKQLTGIFALFTKVNGIWTYTSQITTNVSSCVFSPDGQNLYLGKPDENNYNGLINIYSYISGSWQNAFVIKSNIISSQTTSIVPTEQAPYTFSNLATSNTSYAITLTPYSIYNQIGGSTELHSELYAYAVTNIIVSTMSSTTATLTWTPGSNATSYSIISSPETTTQLTTSSPYSFSNLIGGTTYTFTLTSRNSENRSFESITSSPALYASVPSNLQIQTFSPSNLDLVWTGGENTTNYILTASNISTGSLITQSTSTVPSALAPYTFSNLETSNTSYSITLTAYSIYNQAGGSTSLTTGLYAYTATNLSIVSLTPTTATLDWTAGSNATSYSIVSSPVTTTQIATTSPYTFSNLNVVTESVVYVACISSSTTIATSSDGITWTIRTLPVSANWNEITVNRATGVFVAVSTTNSSVAVYSPDGITWTQQTLPVNANWQAVTVNPTTGIFVALASGTTIAASSPDGITWTQRTLPVSGNWSSVAVNSKTGIFAAISYNSVLPVAVWSADGINWTQTSLPVKAQWFSITVNPNTGIFVAIVFNSSIAATSPDGINWTQRTLPVSALWYQVEVNPNTGIFVAIASASTIAISSTDGINWTQRTLPVSTNWWALAISPTTGVFVAVASGSTIAASSPDGITWTQRVLPQSGSWSCVTGGSGFMVGTVIPYTFTLTSINSNNRSFDSITSSTALYAFAPTNFQIQSSSPSNLDLVWNAGSNTASYILTASNISTGSLITQSTSTIPTALAPYTFSNLAMSNISYSITLTAYSTYNQAGGSMSLISGLYAYTPTNISIDSLTATTATLSWTAGSNATSYSIVSSPATTTQTTTTSPYTFTGLTGGTSYSFIITPRNSINRSFNSITSASTTYAMAATSFQIQTFTQSNIGLVWTAGAGTSMYTINSILEPTYSFTTSGNSSVQDINNKRVYIFNTVGTTTFTVPNIITNCEILIVAGGGAGGGYMGGGGGAGGLVYYSSYTLISGTYTVIVGGGGNAGSQTSGNNGANSSITGLITAIGGGGGGSANGTNTGSLGGSGGGGGAIYNGIGYAGGSNISGQGTIGGSGTTTLWGGSLLPSCGGGGGAATAGSNGISNGASSAGGNGGYGMVYTISGSAQYYAGGGGGGSGFSGGLGGSGGGGNGSTSGNAANATYYGGGGGGAYNNNGGNGYQGIVIISIPIPTISSNIISSQKTSIVPTALAPYTFSNLATSNTSYTIVINSSNVNNQLGGSNQLITGFYAYTASNIIVSKITPTTATLSWINGSNVTIYSITSTPATTTQIAGSSPYTFSNLTSGTTYTFTITSINNVNISFGSITSSSALYAAAPTNFQIQTFTQSNVGLIWTAGSNTSNYILTASNMSTGTSNIQTTSIVPTVLAPYTFSNLATSNTSYTITLTAYSTYNQAGGSNQLITGLYAYSPCNLTVTSFTDTTATLNWTSGSNATSYSIVSSPATTTQTTTTSPYTFTGLTGGTSYTFTVMSRNSQNISFGSNTSSAIIYAMPASSLIGNITSDTAVVTWANGTGASTYKVVTTVNGQSTPVNTQTVSSPTVTVSSLSLTSTSYAINITSSNQYNQQGGSITLITGKYVDPATPMSSSVNTNGVTILWNLVIGGAGVNLEYNPAGTWIRLNSIPITGTSFVYVTPDIVPKESTYYFRLQYLSYQDTNGTTYISSYSANLAVYWPSSLYTLSVNGYATASSGTVGDTTGLDWNALTWYALGTIDATIRVIEDGTNPVTYYSTYIFDNQNGYRYPVIYVHLSRAFTGTVALQSQPGNTTSGTWVTKATLTVSNVTSFYIAGDI